MKKLDKKIAVKHQTRVEERVKSRLAYFVNAVKVNLRSRMKKGGLTPATIRTAEELKEKFNAWGSNPPGRQRNNDSENHLYMDYLLHHRVDLATEIVKSMANGGELSRQREKVLRNSIDYIEQRL
jgi:hypothetical protein